jgi:hypothetical protein
MDIEALMVHTNINIPNTSSQGIKTKIEYRFTTHKFT